VQWLIAAGVDVNAVDGDGYTALMLAAQGGLDELVRLLLENGADPNVRVSPAVLSSAKLSTPLMTIPVCQIVSNSRARTT
jgi:ankyrin repeat protein